MADGDEVQVTGVETDTSADNGAADTSTVLTADTAADGAADSSDAGAADAATADDTGATGDESGNTDAAGDTGDAEGSQTPPDEYADFSMPEGIQLDETMLAEALPVFKELELTQTQAQKLVDFQASVKQADAQKQVDAFNQLKTDWREQSASDKEFGGEAFDENVKLAQSAVNKFGTPELKQLMEHLAKEVMNLLVRQKISHRKLVNVVMYKNLVVMTKIILKLQNIVVQMHMLLQM